MWRGSVESLCVGDVWKDNSEGMCGGDVWMNVWRRCGGTLLIKRNTETVLSTFLPWVEEKCLLYY